MHFEFFMKNEVVYIYSTQVNKTLDYINRWGEQVSWIRKFLRHDILLNIIHEMKGENTNKEDYWQQVYQMYIPAANQTKISFKISALKV